MKTKLVCFLLGAASAVCVMLYIQKPQAVTTSVVKVQQGTITNVTTTVSRKPSGAVVSTAFESSAHGTSSITTTIPYNQLLPRHSFAVGGFVSTYDLGLLFTYSYRRHTLGLYGGYEYLSLLRTGRHSFGVGLSYTYTFLAF